MIISAKAWGVRIAADFRRTCCRARSVYPIKPTIGAIGDSAAASGSTDRPSGQRTVKKCRATLLVVEFSGGAPAHSTFAGLARFPWAIRPRESPPSTLALVIWALIARLSALLRNEELGSPDNRCGDPSCLHDRSIPGRSSSSASQQSNSPLMLVVCNRRIGTRVGPRNHCAR